MECCCYMSATQQCVVVATHERVNNDEQETNRILQPTTQGKLTATVTTRLGSHADVEGLYVTAAMKE